MTDKKNTNVASGSPSGVEGRKLSIRYQWVSSNIPFFLFLAVLAVLYIANGHMADKTIRDISSTAKELKELQYEYKTLKSEMMFKSRETEMMKATEPLGLKITNQPPVHIALESSKKK